MNHPVKTEGKTFHQVCVTIFLLIWGLIPGWWYARFRHSVFALDDPSLINFLSDKKISLLEKTFTNIGANRWRPIANIGFVMVHGLVGNSYFGWWAINVILLGLLVIATTALFIRASGSLLVGLGLGMLVATSRFSQYQVINATGVMEAIGNLLFILMIFGLYEFWRSSKIRWMQSSLMCFTLLIFTHERYQTILLAWFVFISLHFSWNMSRRIKWGIAFALPVVILNVMKKFIFDIPLFVGTGSAWEMGYTAKSATDHFFMAISSLSGMNLGPNYLVGASFEIQNINHQVASLGIVFLFGAILCGPILGRQTHSGATVLKNMDYKSSSLVLIAIMIGSVITTIRLEQRWLVTSYLFLMLGVAVSFYNSNLENRFNRSIRVVPILLFVSLGIFMNFHYRTAVDGVYFRSHQTGAEILLNTVKPVLESSAQFETSLYVVDPNPGANWDAALRPIVTSNTRLQLPNVITVADEADIPDSYQGVTALFLDVTTGILSSRNIVIPPKFEITGDVFPDGWAGKNLTITNISKKCSTIEISIDPKGNWGKNIVTISPSFGEVSRVPITKDVVKTILTPSGEKPSIDIQFKNVWIPADQSASEDVRALSAALTVTCSQP